MAKSTEEARITTFLLRDIDGLVQDCSNSIANAMELLQSCTNPSISIYVLIDIKHQAGYHNMKQIEFTNHEISLGQFNFENNKPS